MSRQAIQVGEDQVVRPLFPGGPTPRGARRVIFLVHGFNNDEVEAGASFSNMRRGVDRILRDAGYADERRKDVQRSIWEVHWPGYIQFGFLSQWRDKRNMPEKAVTMLAYSQQVLKARAWVPDALANYCASLGAASVFFVGHSLGCRVVLETVTRLTSRLNLPLRIDGVLLMAGAVAVHELAPARLGGSTASLDHRFCFYSPKDRVLRYAFPPGQAAAGEIPLYLMPIATGLTGWPRDLWSGTRNTGFGHGGYWDGVLTAPPTTEAAAVMRAVFFTTLVGAAPPQATPALGAPPEVTPPELRPAERHLPGTNWLEGFCV